ncbi:hypothetical protein H5410_041330 [Solanum commersonii]|uniref:Replication factor A C-terminal domain-containing protein n=1 Tax=Solanum commersonii TaxID=4109 RepID=A0A9J5XUG3_SOLCO|nr:hypothetical protein H5410_041330 [Solanum commersonii]
MLQTITIHCPHQSYPYTFTPNVNIVALISPIMRVLVIRRGSVIPYKNSRHEGTFRTMIVVDKEDSLKPYKSYYIAKRRLDRVNSNYSSVHKETEHEVSTHKFSDGFLSLEHADKLFNGAILELICVLVSVKPLIQNENCKRREIRDFAENDGAFLEKLQDDKPILALCDLESQSIKVSIMYCRREIIKDDNKDITITLTKVMRRAINILLVHILDGLLVDSQIHTNRYFNSPLIKFICMFNVYSQIWYIGNLQDCMYKFKETIEDILNRDEPWYSSCKKCHKKVKVIEENVACTNCNSENVEYEMRYCLRLEVCGGERYAQVILFEATKYLLGCRVQEYIESTSVNKEECYYYRKLMLSKDKQFEFLVRIDMNDSNHRRSIIVEEIHQAEEKAPTIMDDKAKTVRMYRKRAKKTTDGAA